VRSLWSGHITFGLITIPVALYSALETAERVGFHLFHKKDMSPIKYKKFCTKEDVEVDNDEIVKGYEIEKKRIAVVEKKELEEVEEEAGGEKGTIDVLEFVEASSLTPLSYETPYYVAPEKGGQKAYGVLRDALGDAHRLGITRITLRKRPLLAALVPGPKVLTLVSLRPFEEIRDPNDLALPASTKTSAEAKMARNLIDQLTTQEWDPSAHPDAYKKALKKLLQKKHRFVVAKEKEREETEGGGQVVDLMDALKKSLAKSAGRSAVKSESKRPRSRGALRSA